MSSIAVVFDRELAIDPGLAAIWCEALDQQARAAAEMHGDDYTPVVLFSPDLLEKLEGDDLADFVGNHRMLFVQADIGVPNAGGFHDDVLGVIFARVLYDANHDVTTVRLSHEILEEQHNPRSDKWHPLGDRREQAGELGDRVEGDTYGVQLREGEPHVRLSNYLRPSAFVPGSARPWDMLGRLDAWDGMTAGGYVIVREPDGSTVDVFAEKDEGIANAAAKKAHAGSRVQRMLGEAPKPDEQLNPPPAQKPPKGKRARAS